jgi:hypothetical protein
VVIVLSYKYGKKRTTPEDSIKFVNKICVNKLKHKRAVRETIGAIKVTVDDLRDTIDGLQSDVSTAEHELSTLEDLIDDLESLL